MNLEKIDPLVVVAISAVIIAIIVFNFLSGGKKHKEEEKPRSSHKSASTSSVSTPTEPAVTPNTTASAAAPAAAKKKKPRSKPKAKKVIVENKFESLATSSAAEGDDDADESDDEDFTDAVIPSKHAQALLKKSKADAKAATEVKVNPEAEKKAAEEKAKKAEAKKAANLKKAAAKKINLVTNTAATEKAAEAKPAEVAAPAAPAKHEDENSHLEVSPAAVPYDGWAVVEDKRKTKPKKEDEEAAPTPAPVVEEPKVEVAQEPAAPAPEIFSEDYVVDAKKLGLLIGPKGATKISIQTATDTTINMPKTEKEITGDVTITVSGTSREGIKKAIHAMHELVTKGYAMLLAAEDFQESYVAVHHKFLPDIIGKGGAVIRALKDHTGVKITVPESAKAPGPDGRIPKVKIGLAGPKDKVSLTRSLIKDLTKFYVTPITHPDLTYGEIDLDAKYYSYIIGTKGSEIKHIQNNFKVQVHIPDENSVNPNIVIVGTAENVGNAKKHIDKIVERVDAAAAAKAAAEALGTAAKRRDENAASVANGVTEEKASSLPAKPLVPAPPGMTQLGGGANNQKAWGAADRKHNDRLPIAQPNADEEEAWTREFLPPSSIPIDIAAMLPPGAKYSNPASNATAPAPIGSKLTPESNPTPSGLPIEPKQPPASSPWNNIPGQW